MYSDSILAISKVFHIIVFVQIAVPRFLFVLYLTFNLKQSYPKHTPFANYLSIIFYLFYNYLLLSTINSIDISPIKIFYLFLAFRVTLGYL